VKLVVAESMGDVRRVLKRFGLTELLGADAIYPSLQEMLAAYEQTTTPPVNP